MSVDISNNVSVQQPKSQTQAEQSQQYRSPSIPGLMVKNALYFALPSAAIAFLFKPSEDQFIRQGLSADAEKEYKTAVSNLEAKIGNVAESADNKAGSAKTELEALKTKGRKGYIYEFLEKHNKEGATKYDKLLETFNNYKTKNLAGEELENATKLIKDTKASNGIRGLKQGTFWGLTAGLVMALMFKSMAKKAEKQAVMDAQA